MPNFCKSSNSENVHSKCSLTFLQTQIVSEIGGKYGCCLRLFLGGLYELQSFCQIGLSRILHDPFKRSSVTKPLNANLPQQGKQSGFHESIDKYTPWCWIAVLKQIWCGHRWQGLHVRLAENGTAHDRFDVLPSCLPVIKVTIS